MPSRNVAAVALQGRLLIGVAAVAGILRLPAVYLREFADISGDLSEDFDTFVRKSFPELVGQ